MSVGRPLGIGIVGLGRVSPAHIQGYLALPGEARVVGVCDANEAVARAVASELGVAAFTDHARLFAVPDLGDLDHKLLWPDFQAQWPSAGPGFKDPFTPMAAWGIPAINTLLLLSSGVTITIAHWALKENKRGQLILFMIFTIALGVLFLALQAFEYGHAYSELNLKLSTGAYGSTFFMLTGFHGFHVTCGAIMLTVILFRCIAGHFKPDHHFGFEGVAWYWHFVDVVWLGLFIFVYWL